MQRITELVGTQEKVRVLRQAKVNSRVIRIDPQTGAETGLSFLVPTKSLLDASAATRHPSRTVRLSDDTMAALATHARAFESVDDVIARLCRERKSL